MKAPSRMKAPVLLVRGTKVIVRWTAASANGSAVSKYVVDISRGKDKTVTGSAPQDRVQAPPARPLQVPHRSHQRDRHLSLQCLGQGPHPLTVKHETGGNPARLQPRVDSAAFTSFAARRTRIREQPVRAPVRRRLPVRGLRCRAVPFGDRSTPGTAWPSFSDSATRDAVLIRTDFKCCFRAARQPAPTAEATWSGVDARQRPDGRSTLTVGVPPPTRAITAKDGSRPGLDSR